MEFFILNPNFATNDTLCKAQLIALKFFLTNGNPSALLNDRLARINCQSHIVRQTQWHSFFLHGYAVYAK